MIIEGSYACAETIHASLAGNADPDASVPLTLDEVWALVLYTFDIKCRAHRTHSESAPFVKALSEKRFTLKARATR